MSMTPTIHPTEQGHIFQNFIAGEWRASHGGETFSSTNPADTREVVGYFQKSTLADLEDAIAAAKKAQPAWAATPAPERGERCLFHRGQPEPDPRGRRRLRLIRRQSRSTLPRVDRSRPTPRDENSARLTRSIAVTSEQ